MLVLPESGRAMSGLASLIPPIEWIFVMHVGAKSWRFLVVFGVGMKNDPLSLSTAHASSIV